MTRAVVFDLWDTLVDWNRDASDAYRDAMVERLGVDADRFRDAHQRLLPRRETGPYTDYLAGLCSELGADARLVDELLELRRAHARRTLVARADAVATIEALRGRGLRTGLITATTSDTAEIWPETPFAHLFDSTVFSCAVGFSKPDPRIYALACEELGVDPGEAVFVGDGANDELAGAERAGMRAVLILRPGLDEPLWSEAHGWQPRIRELRELLELV